jgi:SAM-dependent methyltransferase
VYPRLVDVAAIDSRSSAASQRLELIHSKADEMRLLSDAVRAAYDGVRPVRVLEAGCGKRWHLDTAPVPLEITGVDIVESVMRIRREEHGDIQHEIVGDIREVDLPQAAFDVAYTSYLLEHVDGAELVLDRLVAALAPGGVLIVRVPDGESVYGFGVRRSPHRLHVLYKRHVERKPNAGKPGYAPFPTVYDDVVGESGLRDYAAAHGLTVERAYGTDFYLNAFRALRRPAELGIKLVGKLSGGKLSSDHANIGFVMRKPAA